jgi:hypothetical protein
MTLNRQDKIEDATWEEFSANPEKFGFPTFDRWEKEREKFISRDDDILASADKGSELLSRSVKRHVYELEGYRCKNLEEVERVAREQGINLKGLDYRPQLVQAGAGKYDVIVRFVSKDQRDQREKWA